LSLESLSTTASQYTHQLPLVISCESRGEHRCATAIRPRQRPDDVDSCFYVLYVAGPAERDLASLTAPLRRQTDLGVAHDLGAIGRRRNFAFDFNAADE